MLRFMRGPASQSHNPTKYHLQASHSSRCYSSKEGAFLQRSIIMAYQITLSEQDYAALAAAATRNGTDPERLLHDMIQRLLPSSQRKRPLTAREIAEKQYHEGKIRDRKSVV